MASIFDLSKSSNFSDRVIESLEGKITAVRPYTRRVDGEEVNTGRYQFYLVDGENVLHTFIVFPNVFPGGIVPSVGIDGLKARVDAYEREITDPSTGETRKVLNVVTVATDLKNLSIAEMVWATGKQVSVNW